ncbi:MAG TPA: farnesyl-diphosphate synthase, partial [Clostridiales bacterium]|nr:farnesyl-diphosphate synthase [Clostridiales bacterium]
SLNAGGKRVRFVLALAAAEVYGVAEEDIKPFALAVELIHTYSLIHDDLPALDNDDMRRGKPSNHKVFGEDFAVIAGDGLLNLAYEVLLSACDTPLKVRAAAKIAELAGYRGMVGGQAYDLSSDGKTGEEYLYKIQTGKTCALISAPLVAAEILADKSGQDMLEVGKNLGLIFQFGDDLLDVFGTEEAVGKTLGKDKDENKLTAVKVYGAEKTKEIMRELYEKTVEKLEKIGNAEFLKSFAESLLTRTF